MGKKPFLERLAEETSLSGVFSLTEEIKNLLLGMMKTDKRSLKHDSQKAIFKARLNLYCELYRKAREKFLVVQKKEGASSHFKEPLTFERLMRDFNWQKTVTYSIPVRKDEVDAMADSLYDDSDIEEEIIIIEKNKNMKKPLFVRNSEEVEKSAQELDLVEFLEMYKNTSADEKTLKAVYHEIRGKRENISVDKATIERVGSEASEDALGAVSPTTGSPKKEANPDYPVGAEVEFKYTTGETLIGVILESKTVGKVIVGVSESKDKSTKYPISIDSITEIISFPGEGDAIEVKEKPKVEKKPAPTTPKQIAPVSTPVGALVFKELEKDTKLQLIQELFDSGLKTTGEIKKKLAETYIINHYDDVYNVFIKIKK